MFHFIFTKVSFFPAPASSTSNFSGSGISDSLFSTSQKFGIYFLFWQSCKRSYFSFQLPLKWHGARVMLLIFCRSPRTNLLRFFKAPKKLHFSPAVFYFLFIPLGDRGDVSLDFKLFMRSGAAISSQIPIVTTCPYVCIVIDLQTMTFLFWFVLTFSFPSFVFFFMRPDVIFCLEAVRQQPFARSRRVGSPFNYLVDVESRQKLLFDLHAFFLAVLLYVCSTMLKCFFSPVKTIETE